MTIALVIAGGSGTRMGKKIPKQFVQVYGRPVIIYTLEAFQKHPSIDEIYCVCLAGWQEELCSCALKFGITKLKKIINGGSTVQKSIYNGVMGINTANENDIIVIHDGVRPLVTDSIISDVISKCKQYGNGVSSVPHNEQIFYKKNEETTIEYIQRDKIRIVSTPQAYRYGKLLWAYQKAFAEHIGIGATSYTNTMMVDLGETLHFASGSELNIKLTTKDNLDMFQAYIAMKKTS